MSEEAIECLKCGKEIKKNQKFCTNCGYVLDKKVKTLRILVIIAIIVLLIAILVLNQMNKSYKQTLPKIQETQIKHTMTTLNQVLSLGESLGSGNYKNTDDIIQNKINSFPCNLLRSLSIPP